MLRREAAACALTLITGHKPGMRLLLTHEDAGVAGGEAEPMAQRMFGRLLRECGDYPTQVG